MKCPFCNASDTKVIDSRPADDNSSIRRRRQCEQCGRRFTTYEKLVFDLIDHSADLLGRDRPLVAGKEDPLLQLGTVIGLPGIILFYDHERHCLQLFVCGEPPRPQK